MGDMAQTDRVAFADFLRRSRERLDPGSYALPPRNRTRTPGLRREDVAQLAGVSVDYYSRLEQGRGAHPSAQVVGALARALRLTEDECDYLHRLAGHPTRGPGTVSAHVRPGLLMVLDRLVDAPAQVVSDTGQVLARNAMAEALFGGPVRPGREGNINWLTFTSPEHEAVVLPEDRPRIAAGHVANLRATYAKRPDDAELNALIRDLSAASEDFRELWRRHDVAVLRGTHKTIVHPTVGRIELDCESLLTADGDQRLVVLSARPGTEAVQQLALLRLLGRETLAGFARQD
jgi:transcriptional regulator with XRE-family HTH domain